MAKLSWMKYANRRMLDSRLRGNDGNFGFPLDVKQERDIIALGARFVRMKFTATLSTEA